MSKLNKKAKKLIALDALRATPLAEQQARGYADTLREILQQPATWPCTADLLCQPQLREQLQAALEPRPSHIVLTGSGSSMYIGECLAPSLQLGLGIQAQAIAAGSLLTHWRSVLPPGAGLLISLARSGDSPESCGVVDRLLAMPLTIAIWSSPCNANGKLATVATGRQQLGFFGGVFGQVGTQAPNGRALPVGPIRQEAGQASGGNVTNYAGQISLVIPAEIPENEGQSVSAKFAAPVKRVDAKIPPGSDRNLKGASEAKDMVTPARVSGAAGVNSQL